MVNQIEVTRQFNAPVEMVWKVWTDPELVTRWWGPRQFSAPSAKMDFREGGQSIVCMKAPKEMGEQEFYSLWLYQKIVHLQKIEFIQSLCDQNGNKVNPTQVGMPADFPRDILTIVIFNKLAAEKTELIVTEMAEFGSISHFARLGLEQSMDKMVAIFLES
jgi:uncharacterized protein YndB with AHSA1/START domain